MQAHTEYISKNMPKNNYYFLCPSGRIFIVKSTALTADLFYCLTRK